jgi:DNA topoisomerase-3
MVMTSLSGHLMSTDFEEPYRSNWNLCSPVDLFTAPLVRFVNPDFEGIFKTLDAEAKRCDSIVIWTDCDREGENIGFEVLEICQKANRNLRVFRATFSAFIPREIHQACRRLGPPNKNFSDAVNARIEIDLRIGAAFTRFQTQLLKRKYENMPKCLR